MKYAAEMGSGAMIHIEDRTLILRVVRNAGSQNH
jgi:hypothetical protein